MMADRKASSAMGGNHGIEEAERDLTGMDQEALMYDFSIQIYFAVKVAQACIFCFEPVIWAVTACYWSHYIITDSEKHVETSTVV